MSMDLYLWKTPVVDDPDEARALVDRYFDDSDLSVFAPSGDIAAFADELRTHYPDDWETPPETCPWSSWPFEQTDRLLILNIRWSADNAVLDTIVDLARKHDLVIYDPQGPAVYLASDPVDQPPDEPVTWRDQLSVWVMALGFSAVTAVAWMFIPWGWLRWPVGLAGIFLSISAWIVVYAMLSHDEGRKA